MTAARAVIVPPALDAAPELFLPDLERATRDARLVQLAESGLLKASVLDLGLRGETLPELAARLHRAGCDSITVLATPHELDHARGMLRGLRAASLAADIETSLEALTRTTPGATCPVDDGPRLLVIGENDPTPAASVVFARRADGVLARRRPGRLHGIDARVARIAPGGVPEAVPDWEPGCVLHGVALPTEAVDDDGWQHATTLARTLAQDAGPHAVRLAPPAWPPANGRGGGAAWAARLGLDQPGIRARLWTLVISALPAHAALVQRLVSRALQGVDPEHEMHLGNALSTRNAELLQNIVP